MGKKNGTIAINVNENVDEFLKRLDNLREQAKITKASVKDDLCNYDYEITQGACVGDKLSRKGGSSIHNDLIDSLNKLRPHLAILNDYFEDSSDLEKCSEDVLDKFFVAGFKVSGSDNEGYEIYGTRIVTHGDVGADTPKITISNNYEHFNHLQTSIRACQDEVLQYMNGKAAPVAEQVTMEFEDNGEFDTPIEN